jgi:hypothetical protein
LITKSVPDFGAPTAGAAVVAVTVATNAIAATTKAALLVMAFMELSSSSVGGLRCHENATLSGRADLPPARRLSADG